MLLINMIIFTVCIQHLIKPYQLPQIGMLSQASKGAIPLVVDVGRNVT